MDHWIYIGCFVKHKTNLSRVFVELLWCSVFSDVKFDP